MLQCRSQDLFSYLFAGHEKESQAKVKKYMTIMDSMTDKELDTGSTKIRVSTQGRKGSCGVVSMAPYGD